MNSLAQLEAYTSELAAAVKSLANCCRNVEAPVDFAARNTPQPLLPTESPSEAHRARRSIMANLVKLQTLLDEPADFLQRLAGQVCLSLPITLLDMDAELTWIIAESAPRLSAMAGRFPGPGLYTRQRQRSFQGCCRSCRRSRDAALSYCAYDGHRRLSARTTAGLR